MVMCPSRSWDSYIRSQEAAAEQVCAEHATKCGVPLEQADLCEVGNEPKCKEGCPFSRESPLPGS